VRDSEWQWNKLGKCKSAPHSRQITTPAPHHSDFYKLDALPATQPTASLSLLIRSSLVSSITTKSSMYNISNGKVTLNYLRESQIAKDLMLNLGAY